MKRLLICAMLAAPVSHVFAATAEPAATQSAGKPPEAQAHVARMQQQVQRMQDEMTRMRDAEDAQARQQVMKEHMQTMHAHMETMHAMMQGSGMMSGHQGAGMMGGGMMRGSGEPDMIAQCMQMMQQQSGAPAKPDKR
jgi:uncharacterized protein YlxW (UPF0749 family)